MRNCDELKFECHYVWSVIMNDFKCPVAGCNREFSNRFNRDEHAEKCRREWQAGKRAKHGQQSMFGFFSKAPAQPAAQNAANPAAPEAAASAAAAPEAAAPEAMDVDGAHAEASLHHARRIGGSAIMCHCCAQSALMGPSKWCGSMAWQHTTQQSTHSKE